jgi:hypothetical protein
MTYAQVLDLSANTVLRKLRLNQAKYAYGHRLHALRNPPKP